MRNAVSHGSIWTEDFGVSISCVCLLLERRLTRELHHHVASSGQNGQKPDIPEPHGGKFLGCTTVV